VNLIEHFQNARNPVCVPAGQAIFHEGERGTVMYLLMDGMADLTVGGVMVELAIAGSLIGEMALIDDAERSATLTARTDCKLIAIDSRRFDVLIRESPGFAREVMKVMAERMRRMNERLNEPVELSLPATDDQARELEQPGASERGREGDGVSAGRFPDLEAQFAEAGGKGIRFPD
jgi:CRP/FNR family cyclic AMP-dependent transcriptional regulator